MECIRILHMIGSLGIGGSQAMVMNIYRNIEREKIQFDFIVDSSNEQYFADEIKQLGGKIYSMPKFKGTNLLEIKKKWNRFFIEHPEYKILHSHVRSYASIYLPIAKKHGVKTIIHSHSTSNGSGMSALVKAVLQYPLRYQADYFFGCSKESGEWLFGSKVVNSNSFYVVKNGIDVDRFLFNRIERNKIREQLRISETTLVIGHVGRFIEAKNHDFLIDLFAELNVKKRDSKLLLVGDGKLRKHIKKKCKDLKIEDDVIFVGNQSNTEMYYSAMDMFCFPSLWEGLGIAVIEAQTSGLRCFISKNIPDEVDMGLNLVTRLDLNNNEEWIDKMSKSVDYNRFVDRKIIRNSGYDISENTEMVQKFYLEI